MAHIDFGHVDLGHVDIGHVDVPPPHVDVPPPHVDLGHADLGHVDLGHVDVGHVDVPPPHVDVPPPHVDLGHIDLGHVDAGHVDLGHIDIGHVDAGHVDFGHIDVGHVDAGHVDVGHVDLGHIDVGHVDLVPHIDVGYPTVPLGAAPPHVDAAPPHADTGYNHWWQNWPKTHGYVAKKMFFATSVDDIATAVRNAEADQVHIRAVGGGWSFSDASLPGNVGPSLAAVSATGRPDVSTVDAIAHALPLAQGYPSDEVSSIASIDASNGWLIGYNEQNVRLLGGARRHVAALEATPNLTPPQPQPAYLLNTRSLKSTLQTQLGNILSAAAQAATAPGPNRKFYFHVEAGITMEEIAPLLDAQSPRLQLGASGGNPGATLAGTLSTATHGAELAAHSLLIDRVRAVHLVGPGGQQWWIEGATSVADPAKLTAQYPGLDAAHIITGTAPVDGFLPQDWLNAVVVAMGSVGVIYSAVIEVLPRQGSQQVCKQTQWTGTGSGPSVLDVVRTQNPALAGMTNAQLVTILRTPTEPHFALVNLGIAHAMTSGVLTGGLISDSASGLLNANQYADLAFNPNPAPASSHALTPGDFDCWLLSRRFVPNAPFDPQPPSGGGIGTILNDVFVSLARAFAINNNPGNLAHLVSRLADVYGLSTPLHVDIPIHVDVPPPHIDIPSPHIDVPSPHVDVPSPHIDIPSPHIDVGHVDLHVDTSFFGNHVDIGSPHVDVPSPHVDIPSPHIDIPSPHIDIPSPHIDVPPPHIDVGHVDLNSVVAALENPLTGVVGAALGLVPAAVPIVQALLLAGHDLSVLVKMIETVADAADTLDVLLDQLTAPLVRANAVDLAQPFLTGLLASILGTDNDEKIGVSVGAQVGSVGFPDSGLLGAGIEVALPVETAFGFLQSHVLDKINPQQPFFGYVSVRICPQSSTLMGMQQWPTSVMIEVVSFGDPSGIALVGELQREAVGYIAARNDAMLHWGLENDQLTAAHLAAIPALQSPTVAHTGGPNLSKLAAFRAIRALVFSNLGANPGTLFSAFDNAFTRRLGL
jgi:hypothetical protein